MAAVRRKRAGGGRTKNLSQGIYEPVNKDKYVGAKSPRYLSSYELQVFKMLDAHPSILKWGAEVVVVPYYNIVKERKARYIVDIYVKYQTRTGEIIEELIEIKPYAQTIPPVKTPRKRQDVYEEEVRTFAVNQAKWEAAGKFASERGWRFRKLTEHQIFKQ